MSDWSFLPVGLEFSSGSTGILLGENFSLFSSGLGPVGKNNRIHTGLIRNIKINFIPDSNLRLNVLRDITFEDAGVEEDDVYYGSLANYKKVKGLDGSGTEGGGTPGGV